MFSPYASAPAATVAAPAGAPMPNMAMAMGQQQQLQQLQQLQQQQQQQPQPQPQLQPQLELPPRPTGSRGTCSESSSGTEGSKASARTAPVCTMPRHTLAFSTHPPSQTLCMLPTPPLHYRLQDSDDANDEVNKYTSKAAKTDGGVEVDQAKGDKDAAVANVMVAAVAPLPTLPYGWPAATMPAPAMSNGTEPNSMGMVGLPGVGQGWSAWGNTLGGSPLGHVVP